MTSQLIDNKINYMATIQNNADLQLSVNSEDYGYDTNRCNTMHYFNVRSRADTQPTIKKWGERKKLKLKTDMLRSIGPGSPVIESVLKILISYFTCCTRIHQMKLKVFRYRYCPSLVVDGSDKGIVKRGS